MSEGVALEEREVAAEPSCIHHWIIETPHGAMSWGVCKLCGAKKEFPNAAPDSLWEGNLGPGAGRWSSFGGSSEDGSFSYATRIDSESPGDDF